MITRSRMIAWYLSHVSWPSQAQLTMRFGKTFLVGATSIAHKPRIRDFEVIANTLGEVDRLTSQRPDKHWRPPKVC